MAQHAQEGRMTHFLKIWQGSFEAIASGAKTHEVRRADRDFKVGDQLILREFIPEVDQQTGQPRVNDQGETIDQYTKRNLYRKITYITPGGSWGLPNEVCVLSIK